MRPRYKDGLHELLLYSVCIAHILICPFTKVEESFNLHAINDILTKGISDEAVKTYDHITFTGPLPRSFIGALTVAAASYPFVRIAEILDFRSPLLRQIIIRSVLALSNAACLVFVARRLKDVFNTRAYRKFLILTACQFHVPFWIGRTVPNMLAFGPSQIALALILLPKQRLTRRWSRPDVLVGIAILTSLTIILRLELAGLLIPLTLQALYLNRLDWLDGAFTGLTSALLSLSATLSADSHFWQESVWPELHNLFFNVVEGKSEQWGTSPWYTYFAFSLPRLLLLAFPLAAIGALKHSVAQRLSVPLLAHVSVMSLLKHKEWRFIVYILPSCNVLALAGLTVVRRYNRRLSRFVFLCICSFSLGFTLLSTFISTQNYPGGYGLLLLNRHLQEDLSQERQPIAHLDVYGRMTGASNLLHLTGLTYNRNESLTEASQYTDFDYVLTHEPRQLSGLEFEAVDTVKGWAGLQLQISQWKEVVRRRNLQNVSKTGEESLVEWIARIAPVRLRIEDQVWVLKNRKNT